ncbi:MAG: PilZ domain-containing protein [Armatimonadetes bacterium]|nr:PilZ domain-containing protein [Armatimonadota bacterium]
MRIIRDKRLVFMDRELIRDLLSDLSHTGEAVSVTARDLPTGTHAKVDSVAETTFTIQLLGVVPRDYVSLSSWRFDVFLKGANLSFATMAMSRGSEGSLVMSLPEMLVSGDGRQSYRITVTENSVPVRLEIGESTIPAEIMDASMEGAKIRAGEELESTLGIGDRLLVSGEKGAIRFRKPAIVGWVQDNTLGVALPTIENDYGDEDTWHTFVKSLAYDHVVAKLKRSA